MITGLVLLMILNIRPRYPASPMSCSYSLTRFVSSAIYYYRWSEDSFTQGSYSETVVGFSSDDFIKLGQNLGRLYFGGEATSEEWYGYMQGAYLTGEEKGKLIACQILPSDSECKAAEKKNPKSGAPFAVKSRDLKDEL